MVATLEDLYEQADSLELTPGWIGRETPLFWPRPNSAFGSHHWSYADAHAALDVAGGLIDVELAERRNLVMRNPTDGNDFATLRTFACAYQMILPGEVAPSHRHSAHALRVIVDSIGSYSVVDGVKIPMETGDIVLTPGGMWHGHGHEGTEAGYWLDILDLAFVHLTEAMFYEEHPDGVQAPTNSVETSPYRLTAADIAADLAEATAAADGTKTIGLPTAGIPTMTLTVTSLPAGTTTEAQRGANRIFVAMEGSGRTTVDGAAFEWSRGDTVVAPIWATVEHQTDEAAQLFCASDEAALRALGYYRAS
ncbi:cupin domain-containing protein [Pedococcus sp. P5_B7]